MFKVARTYSIIDPTSEACSNGDYSEEGFVFETQPMGLKDLLRELDELYYYENLDSHNDTGSQALYGCDPIDQDLSTGAETYHAIHIEGPPRAMRRLVRLLKTR